MKSTRYSYSSRTRRSSLSSISTNPTVTPSAKSSICAQQDLHCYKSPDKFSPKSVIFCLAIRKAYKNSSLRLTKFSFYLMRSLYKELTFSSRRSISSTPSRRFSISSVNRGVRRGVKFNLLAVRKKEFVKALELKTMKKVLKFCKEFESVRRIRSRRVDRIKRGLVRVDRSFVRKGFGGFYEATVGSGRRKGIAVRFMNLLARMPYRRLRIAIRDNKMIKKVYVRLNKPIRNLPVMHFERRPELAHKKIASPPPKSLYLQNFRAKAASINKIHLRALNYLVILNKNHRYLKRQAFQNLISNRTHSKARTIQTHNYTTSNSYKFYLRTLNYLTLFNKNHIYLKTQAFNNLAFFVNQHKERQLEIRDKLTQFSRVLYSKLFNKRYAAFVHIKSSTRHSQKRKYYINRTPDIQIFSKALSRLFDSHQDTLITYSFGRLKSHYTTATYRANCQTLYFLLRKINNHSVFCQYLEGFSQIKLKSLQVYRLTRLRSSKLLSLLKKFYTKFTALGFLKWESLLHRIHFNTFISKSYKSVDNSYSMLMNSYESKRSPSRHLPHPVTIHDYIDDVQEIVESDVPVSYFRYSVDFE